jgi:hypothetical protein
MKSEKPNQDQFLVKKSIIITFLKHLILIIFSNIADTDLIQVS